VLHEYSADHSCTVASCRSKLIGKCKVPVTGFDHSRTHQLDLPLSGVNSGFLHLTVAITTAQQESDALRKIVHQQTRPLATGLVEVRVFPQQYKVGQEFISLSTTVQRATVNLDHV
jgi:hypothetical protein